MTNRWRWGVRIKPHGTEGGYDVQKLIADEWRVIAYCPDWHSAVIELEKWQRVAIAEKAYGVIREANRAGRRNSSRSPD